MILDSKVEDIIFPIAAQYRSRCVTCEASCRPDRYRCLVLVGLTISCTLALYRWVWSFRLLFLSLSQLRTCCGVFDFFLGFSKSNQVVGNPQVFEPFYSVIQQFHSIPSSEFDIYSTFLILLYHPEVRNIIQLLRQVFPTSVCIIVGLRWHFLISAVVIVVVGVNSQVLWIILPILLQIEQQS